MLRPPSTRRIRSADVVGAFVERRARALLHLRYFTLLCIFTSIVVAIMAAEEVYARRWSGDAAPLGRTPWADTLKIASTALTALLCGLAVTKAAVIYEVRGAQKRLIPGQSFFDTDICRSLFAELLVSAVHCPAGVYALINTTNPINVTITYDLDSLLSVLQFLRLGLLVSMLVKEFSGMDGKAARHVQRSLHLTFDSAFASRHMLDARPILSVALI